MLSKASWIVLPLWIWVSVECLLLPPQVKAQTQGTNAVWLTGTQPTQSPAFVDASQFSGADICGQINAALVFVQQHFPAGAVIDARGLGPSNSTMTCYQGATPWVYQGSTVNIASTLLLPAATITIQAPWVLPNNTRVVGVTPNPSQATTLEVGSCFQLQPGDVGNAMIEMGSQSLCASAGCSGISVEHLTLDTTPTDNVCSSPPPRNGIYNGSSQDQSYVNDVNLVGMSLTGLSVVTSSSTTSSGTSADGSGPYSNLAFVASSTATCAGMGSGSSCPACVLLQAQTRGLHAASCIGNALTEPPASGSPEHAGIYVNTSNNSISDVHVENFWDGIEVGDIGSQVSNVVISNVTSGRSQANVTNSVHICGPRTTSFGQCSHNTDSNVSDVVVLEDTDEPQSASSSTAIQDDQTDTSITPPSTGLGATVGLYALGELVADTGGYSRFSSFNSNTQSTVVPTWGVGSARPTTSTCQPGTLFSATGGSSGSTIWVCTMQGTWAPIA
jgi:hypothetical protein